MSNPGQAKLICSQTKPKRHRLFSQNASPFVITGLPWRTKPQTQGEGSYSLFLVQIHFCLADLWEPLLQGGGIEIISNPKARSCSKNPNLARSGTDLPQWDWTRSISLAGLLEHLPNPCSRRAQASPNTNLPRSSTDAVTLKVALSRVNHPFIQMPTTGLLVLAITDNKTKTKWKMMPMVSRP